MVGKHTLVCLQSCSGLGTQWLKDLETRAPRVMRLVARHRCKQRLPFMLGSSGNALPFDFRTRHTPGIHSVVLLDGYEHWHSALSEGVLPEDPLSRHPCMRTHRLRLRDVSKKDGQEHKHSNSMIEDIVAKSRVLQP